MITSGIFYTSQNRFGSFAEYASWRSGFGRHSDCPTSWHTLFVTLPTLGLYFVGKKNAETFHLGFIRFLLNIVIASTFSSVLNLRFFVNVLRSKCSKSWFPLSLVVKFRRKLETIINALNNCSHHMPVREWWNWTDRQSWKYRQRDRQGEILFLQNQRWSRIAK